MLDNQIIFIGIIDDSKIAAMVFTELSTWFPV